MKGETGIVFLFHFWRTARPGIENTEGPFFCTFLCEFWNGVVTGEREGKMPVALSLPRKALKGLHLEMSGYDIDIIHATLFHLLQRLTEFLEGVRLEGGHVNSVMVGETSCNSETMGWFSLRGGNKWFCRVFHIVEHLQSF